MSFSPKIIVDGREFLLKKFPEILKQKERGCNIIGCFSSHDKSLSEKWETEYNICSLCFDDIDYSGNTPVFYDCKENSMKFTLPPNCVLFDESLTRKCIDYIISRKNLLNWVIFCDVGVSRSPAIGDFIARTLSEAANDWHIHYEYMLDYAYKTHPNQYVLSKLNRYYDEVCQILSNKIKNDGKKFKTGLCKINKS